MTIVHPWTVTVVAEGDRPLTDAEFSRLSEVVTGAGGTALGAGTSTYGLTIVLAAGREDEAVELGTTALRNAARLAELPEWPISSSAAGDGPPGSALDQPDAREHSGHADLADPPDD